MAATSVVFLLPVVLFTFAVRNHLLRGVTFGAVRTVISIRSVASERRRDAGTAL